MAREEHLDKDPAELADRAWELAAKIRIALLTTWDGNAICVRPMSATVRRERHAIYFLTEATSTKVPQIATFPDVMVAFADEGSNKFVTFRGRAQVTNDRALIRDLWTPFAKAWWDGPDDPSIRAVTVEPSQAELWDGPNKLTASVLMLTAALTGAKPAVGDHGVVAV